MKFAAKPEIACVGVVSFAGVGGGKDGQTCARSSTRQTRVCAMITCLRKNDQDCELCHVCDVIMEMMPLSVHVAGNNMVGKCVRAFRFGFAGTSSALCCWAFARMFMCSTHPRLLRERDIYIYIYARELAGCPPFRCFKASWLSTFFCPMSRPYVQKKHLPPVIGTFPVRFETPLQASWSSTP